MPDSNFSLQTNMQQQSAGVDPFAQARQMQQQSAMTAPDASVMSHPFTGLLPDQQAQMQQQPQPQLSTQMPQQSPPFMALAQQMGVNANGLHQNRDVARLQLVGQLQQLHGPDFASHPQYQSLMQAFDQHRPPDQQSTSQMTSQSKRTLEAIMKA